MNYRTLASYDRIGTKVYKADLVGTLIGMWDVFAWVVWDADETMTPTTLDIGELWVEGSKIEVTDIIDLGYDHQEVPF